jgi:predicted CXXCH cytochrome family protein
MPSLRATALLAATALAMTLAGCTDTKDVLVAKPLYTDPPTAADSFLGYSDTVAKLPSCGNCHVAKYDSWKGTKHASAWADLQASGHATSSCDACHTVNSYGNYVTDTLSGFLSTQDARYHDVQCESCHGPGLDHVQNPSIQTEPLASIMVGVGLTNGCGECHTGSHNPFTDEWVQSMHADTTNHGITHRAAACDICHSARGVLDAWGVNTNYIEKNTAQLIPVTCAVCHDPHDATNEYQLRYPIDVRNVDQNLCMKCHQYDAVPNPATPYGPMSPQGPLLLGQAGWRAPDFMSATDSIYGTHGSAANTDLCATCHMYKFNVTDSTGASVWNYQGHEFQATPCLDSKGIPEATSNCDIQQRNFDACATSGCHGSADAARSAYTTAETRIADLAAQLDSLVVQAPASEFVTGDNKITTAEGAKFNVELAQMEGSAIHNPFLMEDLLTASIKQMEKDYGLQAAPGLNLNNILPTLLRR